MDINAHSFEDALDWIEDMALIGYEGELNFTLIQNDKWPWRIHIRSFISSPTTGLLFRGDGRVPSLITDDSVTSRVRTTFVVNPAKGTITDPDVISDYTMFYGTPSLPGQPYLSPEVDEGIPEATIADKFFSNGRTSFDFHHFGKDPLTPGFITPSLDVHSTLSITEDLENGVLTITGSFIGDSFPSAEAFVVDQSGTTKVFLGVYKETGGVHNLFGDNRNPLFDVNMQIMFDDEGKFTGVCQEGQMYTVDEWNKHVQDEF